MVAILVARRDLADGTRTQVRCMDWRSISSTELVATATSLEGSKKLTSGRSSTAIVLPNTADWVKIGPVEVQIKSLTK